MEFGDSAFGEVTFGDDTVPALAGESDFDALLKQEVAEHVFLIEMILRQLS